MIVLPLDSPEFQEPVLALSIHLIDPLDLSGEFANSLRSTVSEDRRYADEIRRRRQDVIFELRLKHPDAQRKFYARKRIENGG